MFPPVFPADYMPTALILCAWVVLVHFLGFVFLIVVYQRFLSSINTNIPYIVEEDPLLRVYAGLISTTIILAVITLGHGTLFMGNTGGVTAMLIGIVYLNVGTLALRSVTRVSRPLFPSRGNRATTSSNRRLQENLYERYPANRPPSYSLQAPNSLPTISVISSGPTGPSTGFAPTAYSALDLPPPYWEVINTLEAVLEEAPTSSTNVDTHKENANSRNPV